MAVIDQFDPWEGDPTAPMLEAVTAYLVRDALEELDRPHVLLIVDGNGQASYVAGPFPDALAAATAAESERRIDEVELGAANGRTYSVKPLLAPSGGSENGSQAVTA